MTTHEDGHYADLEQLRRENSLLQQRIRRLEREAASMQPIIAEVKRLKIWDFTPYGVRPDDSWLALDRASATELMRALAGTDHWHPWQSRIEPRPQP
ncbi:hypothetical protein [Arthrobacter mangrovi]|uniref:Uncharacterized protein n=1 Tax=Arthrobacter mangrovi TaxID=2966350 RepID=A0ABQ5MWJ6_9MICC|nr:hypothetical protein [Arthrobacter mangrovi]GLB68310.1 hypothetical protein AHIS1636_27520 [Arthrobacter mangrovi]